MTKLKHASILDGICSIQNNPQKATYKLMSADQPSSPQGSREQRRCYSVWRHLPRTPSHPRDSDMYTADRQLPDMSTTTTTAAATTTTTTTTAAATTTTCQTNSVSSLFTTDIILNIL